MSDRPIIIVGAGGHGAVVADALRESGAFVLGFVDSAPELAGRDILGLPVLGDETALAGIERSSHILANGIGGAGRGPSIRRAVAERLGGLGWTFATVRHPGAIIAGSARLDAGSQALAAATIQPRAAIGEGVIVNTGAIVEHDCEIGAWSHVSVGAILCGGVRIGVGCHIGAGATVIQGVTLGESTLVGAGAAVTASFGDGARLTGVPARASA